MFITDQVEEIKSPTTDNPTDVDKMKQAVRVQHLQSTAERSRDRRDGSVLSDGSDVYQPGTRSTNTERVRVEKIVKRRTGKVQILTSKRYMSSSEVDDDGADLRSPTVQASQSPTRRERTALQVNKTQGLHAKPLKAAQEKTVHSEVKPAVIHKMPLQ